MARKRRTYSRPLIVTLASAGALAACGGDDETIGNPPCLECVPATGGGWTSPGAIGGTGGALGGGTGGIVGVSGGVGANPPWPTTNPPEVPRCEDTGLNDYMTQCEVGQECLLSTSCTSGRERAFLMRCSGDDYPSWQLTEESCAYPAEFCRVPSGGSVSCFTDTWIYSGVGGNPPAPCPEEAPAEDSACNAGAGFGTDRQACGYPCDNGEWTILGCFGESFDDGTWQGDGACDDAPSK